MTDEGRRDALVERLFAATIGTLELFSVHVGLRLGLYDALGGGAGVTAPGLATELGLDERYLREWLEQQAVAGILEVDDASAAPDERRFSLPAAHAEVLVDQVSTAYVVPFAPMVVGIAGALPAVVEAFRSGAGVPYTDYGVFADGQAAINRPGYHAEMAAWLAGIPDVHARLGAAPPARVADLGCGYGWSSLAIARAYPRVLVEGIDSDAGSVREAALRTAAPEVEGRLTFAVRDAGTLADGGPYDLVTIFEALHDMAAPVRVLGGARAALAPGGAVLVVDERVADTFTAPGDEVERAMYGWSVTHCLPASRAESPSAALGTALRASTVLSLAAEAGFSSAEVLPIENDFFRFYLLRP